MEQLSNNLSKSLLLNEQTCDIWLVVCSQRLPGHKAILAARSPYFMAMFYGQFIEKGQTDVILNDVHSIDAFKALLTWIYTGRVNLMGLHFDIFTQILLLASQYQIDGGLIDELSTALIDYV